MTEPIGEIVARIEHCLVDPKGEPGFSDDDLRALIASWRERGEALKPFAEMADSFDALRDSQDNYACPAKSKIEEDCERARAKVGRWKTTNHAAALPLGACSCVSDDASLRALLAEAKEALRPFAVSQSDIDMDELFRAETVFAKIEKAIS